MPTSSTSPLTVNPRPSSPAAKHRLSPERSDKGFLRSLALSLLVHALLLAALTWGVNWQQQTQTTPVQAELWSSAIQQAPPLLPAPSVPEPLPEMVKPVVPVAEPAKPTPPSPAPQVDPQIAIEKAKQLKALKEKQAQEQRLKEQEKARELERAEKAKADKEKLAKLEAIKEAKELKEKNKQEAARIQAAADKARTDALRRMNQLAGQAGGAEDAKNSRNSAPSEGYLGRIAGRIKPNVAYSGDKSAAIVTSFEVRLNAEGRVVAIQMIASSGVRAWDDAAQRAIEKTEVFPLDGGRVHSPMTIRMTPRD